MYITKVYEDGSLIYFYAKAVNRISSVFPGNSGGRNLSIIYSITQYFVSHSYSR